MMNFNNVSAGSRRAVRTLLLSCLLLAPLARAQVIPFVDNYQTNVSANTTPETNAAIALADDLEGWVRLDLYSI